MIFYLHYLAQTDIINIVKLAVLKTVLPIHVDKLANTLEAMMYHFYLLEYSGLSILYSGAALGHL